MEDLLCECMGPGIASDAALEQSPDHLARLRRIRGSAGELRGRRAQRVSSDVLLAPLKMMPFLDEARRGCEASGHVPILCAFE